MKRNSQIDDSLREAVRNSLSALGIVDEKIVAAVGDDMVAHAGGAVQRRKSMSDIRAAFREGFLTGQSQGRHARWHSIIWTHSPIAKRLRDDPEKGAEVAARYSDYNY